MGGMSPGERDKGDLFCVGDSGGSGYTGRSIPGS